MNGNGLMGERCKSKIRCTYNCRLRPDPRSSWTQILERMRNSSQRGLLRKQANLKHVVKKAIMLLAVGPFCLSGERLDHQYPPRSRRASLSSSLAQSRPSSPNRSCKRI